MEDAERFTTLLQTSIVLNILWGDSINFKTTEAFLSFSSASARMRSLFVVVSAVSMEEKNADKIIKIMKLWKKTEA